MADLNLGGKVLAVRTNKDGIRSQLGGTIESRVSRRESELVAGALNAGLEVILDNSHFNPHHERRYKLLAEKHGYKFELKSFVHVSLEECIRRDQNRLNSVGEALIRSMYERYLPPKSGKKPIAQGRLLQWPR